MYSLNTALGRQAWLAPLFLRVVLGGLFLLHGIDKFDTGLDNVEGFFASNGVPAASLTAPLTAVAEIVLGVALTAGLATRVAALLLAALLVGAIIFVKADAGILGSAETDLAYLAGLLALTVIGPGRLSADEALSLDAGATTIDSPTAVPAH